MLEGKIFRLVADAELSQSPVKESSKCFLKQINLCISLYSFSLYSFSLVQTFTAYKTCHLWSLCKSVQRFSRPDELR